jgi:hypothetical protein
MMRHREIVFAYRVSSGNFILGGKLTDSMAVRPWLGWLKA